MTIEKILAEIDAEISRLSKARALLSTNGAKVSITSVKPKPHKLSLAARKRISDAQRKRWAKQKAETE